MILVILGIGLALLTVGIGLYIKLPSYNKRTRKQDNLIYALNGIGGSLAAVSLCVILVLSITLSNRGIVDDKIAMYQEENTNIEEQIAATVKQYQEYETEIFTEVKPESSITLVALYPELKSDTLVQKQIEVYTANNQKIKELKEEKLNYKPMAWWLYFGK